MKASPLGALAAVVGAAVLAATGSLALAWMLSAPVGQVPVAASRLVVCVALLAISLVGYVQWPSRWNLVAHAQFAFAVFAYIVPVLVFDPTEVSSPSAWNLLARVLAIGAAATLIGTALSGYGDGLFARSAVAVASRIDRLHDDDVLPRRVGAVIGLAVGALVVSFAVMGFVPALADDPFAAKFFRGEYAEAYRPVAPLYRAATALLALLLPMAAYYAWSRRTIGWSVLFVASTGGMLLTLQRGPAISGVLLFVGVLAARRRGLMLPYLLGLVSVYLLGSGVYALVGVLGFGGFQEGGDVDLLRSAAAGAPDVADALAFLQYWLLDPTYTWGRTFVGGLVPSNFEWNPSVWTLAVVNPGSAITAVASGGFRLPPPVWGLVSFSWPGVVLVSMAHGWLMGRLARSARAVVPRSSIEANVLALVLYGVMIDLVARFYMLSYMTVLEVSVMAAILFVKRSPDRSRRVEGRAPYVRSGAGSGT